ncbi:hypothetical protein HNR65_000949 [Desulfosalsimonas propionicica]|uniref:DUF748 domain-containing protein n=1 Tax=Desulfosalsimonas propionicica TaxID=332175 RepID=A0A7W0C7J6_9BACT|nr:hypothetical protein [Desulfosalsimonas propionicica]
MAVYAIAGFVILPIVAQKKLPAVVSDALNAKVTIADIDFNPFTFRAAVNGLAVVQNNGEALLEADQAAVNVQLASAVKMGAVIKSVEIKAPRVHLVRRADGSFNFSDLAGGDGADEKEQAADPEDGGSPVYFSVASLRLTDGQVVFADQSAGFDTTVESVSVSVDNLSSEANAMADLEIRLQSREKETIAASGRLGLFPLSAEARIDAENLSVAHYAPFYQDFIGLEIADGRLDVSGDIIYPQPSPVSENPLLEKGQLRIRSLLIRDPDTGNAALNIDKFSLSGIRVNPEKRSVDVKNISTRGGKILCERAQNGTLNFSKLTAGSGSANGSDTDPPPEKTKPVPSPDPWNVHLGMISVSGYSAAYTDAVPKEPVSLGLDGITIRLYDMTLQQDHLTEWSFASLARPGIVSAQGAFQVNPVSADFDFRISEVDLAGAAPYAKDFGADIQKGIVHAAGSVEAGITPDGFLAKYTGEARIDDFTATDPKTGNNFLKFARLGFEDIQAEMADQLLVSLDRILIQEPQFAAGLGPDGRLLPSLLAGKNSENSASDRQKKPNSDTAEQKSEAGENEGGRTKAPGYEVTVNRVDLKNGGVVFTDQTVSPEIAGRLNPINAHVSGFRLDPEGAVFDFQLTDLALAGAGPLAAPYGADIQGGRVNLSGSVEAQTGDNSQTRFQGKARIEDFAAADPESGRPFFTFDRLGFENIRAESADVTTVALERVLLQKPVLTFGFEQDGRIFPPALAGGDSGDSGDTDEAADAARADGKNASGKDAPAGAGDGQLSGKPSFQADIRKIEMQAGELAFFDKTVSPPFATRLSPMDASISDVELDPENVTDFTVNGQLDGRSPFSVSGKIRPLSPKAMTLTDVSFENIEMPMFTPYFGKYLGYEIQKGKLHLDLGYQVDSLKLDGKNQVRLDQFYLGNKVQSDDAISLPLKLALALLRDRAGRIDLNVPVEGDMGNPQFRLGGVIFDAFVNLLKRLVTSPFSALASLVPGAEELSFVDFAPGSAELTDKGQEKLVNLATALYDRPSLRLLVRPGADRQKDREAFQQQKLKELVIAEKGTDAELLSEEEYEKILKKLCKSADIEIKDMSVPDMEAAFKQTIEIPDTRLRQLAVQRGSRVQSALLADDRIEAGRVFMESPKIADQPRVEFELEAE